jgi:uncharacterized protein YukE
MKADVQMDYGDMEDMKKIFSDSAKALEDLNSQVKTWSSTLNDGVLLGDAGEALANAFNTRLSSKIQALIEKLKELEGDIAGAIQFFRDGERDARSRFL